MKLKVFTVVSLTFGLLLLSSSVSAEEAKVAVTEDFFATMQELKQKFEKSSTHKLLITTDSTAKLYNQIKKEQAFDLFLADDTGHPKLLEENDYAVPDSRIVYAIGKLTLWSRKSYLVDSQGRVLTTTKFNKLAMVDPKSGSYGAAAQEILQKLNLWEKLGPKIVKNATLSKTYEIIDNGDADLGFISLSQITKIGDKHSPGSLWVVPPHFYERPEQNAVLLKRGQDNMAAKEFIAFLQRSIARSIIENFGYETP